MAEGAHPQPVFRSAGEACLLIEFGDALDEAISNAALAFEAALRAAAIDGVAETAPTLRSVAVAFDPLALAPDALRGRLSELLAERDWLAAPPPEGRRLWRLPARYGGAEGPDLAEVAGMLGLSEDAAAEAHAASRQRVTMLGFAPGFAYLGVLPERWALPRLPAIKPQVPAGAISVAIRQTVLSATPAPTGWRTIARTPFRNFRPAADDPAPLKAGDEVVFEPVAAADYARLAARAETGEAVAAPEPIR